MKRVSVAVLGLCIGLWSSVALAGAPLGLWVSQEGDVKVRLSDCGGKLCGHVVWLREANDPRTGALKTDKLNPDPAKRSRPLIGLEVATGFVPNGPQRWSGTIYNADDGHVYRANLIVKSARTARLEGCMLVWLCMGHIWHRVDGGAQETALR
ncbi:MAG TPA: DUF2147 domain-containing protein [Pseudolabrys sp.]|jgi:uncharacterized protein (DUF2147 family)|nr:DUF2147 domain-containing protein [Pseudolabrys sp.]